MFPSTHSISFYLNSQTMGWTFHSLHYSNKGMENILRWFFSFLSIPFHSLLPNEAYALNTREWHLFTFPPSASFIIQQATILVSIDGALHWLAQNFIQDNYHNFIWVQNQKIKNRMNNPERERERESWILNSFLREREREIALSPNPICLIYIYTSR